MSCSRLFVLVGDSDIDRWPADLLPSITTNNNSMDSGPGNNNNSSSNDINYDSNGNDSPVVHDGLTSQQVYGHSGATLAEILPVMQTVLENHEKQILILQKKDDSHHHHNSLLTVVFCAGENDIGQNIRLDETLSSFRTLLDMVVPQQPAPIPRSTTATTVAGLLQRRHLIVLGPKLEPWLEYDATCRKQYVKLSMAMDRACQKHVLPSSSNKSKKDDGHHHHKLTYVNCLTMFCGASGQQPGATLGGKGIPEKRYFDHDLLHLSREGYQVWQETVNKILREEASKI